MSKLLYPRIRLDDFGIDGKVTVTLTGCTPKSQQTREITMEMSETSLKLLARTIRDRMRALKVDRDQQNIRNLHIFTDGT